MGAVLAVFHYQTSDKRIPYREWLDTVRNPVAFAAVQLRVDRLERGLFGDCAPVGEGVWELRIDYGPGYRVYYASGIRVRHHFAPFFPVLRLSSPERTLPA